MIANYKLKVPSCSRCTAKGLVCTPRSTRRTSDSSYRTTKKHAVSPKRFMPNKTIQSISRQGSPRSVPTPNRHQLVRAVSQMDFNTAVKLGQHTPEFAAMSMLTPLQTYTPHIVDEFYSYSSSPETAMSAFPPSMEKPSFIHSELLTPQTPDTFLYPEPVAMPDSNDQYMGPQVWFADRQMPIGLGFENDMPELMPSMDQDMRVWAPEFERHDTPIATMHNDTSPLCPTPISANPWPDRMLSVAPSPRAVPSLSISECSAQDSDSSNTAEEERFYYQNVPGNLCGTKPATTTPYLDSIRTMPMDTNAWGEGMHMRMSITHIGFLWLMLYSIGSSTF